MARCSLTTFTWSVVQRRRAWLLAVACFVIGVGACEGAPPVSQPASPLRSGSPGPDPVPEPEPSPTGERRSAQQAPGPADTHPVPDPHAPAEAATEAAGERQTAAAAIDLASLPEVPEPHVLVETDSRKLVALSILPRTLQTSPDAWGSATSVATLHGSWLYYVEDGRLVAVRPFDADSPRPSARLSHRAYALRCRELTCLVGRTGGVDLVDLGAAVPLVRTLRDEDEFHYKPVDFFVSLDDTLVAVDDIVRPKLALLFSGDFASARYTHTTRLPSGINERFVAAGALGPKELILIGAYGHRGGSGYSMHSCQLTSGRFECESRTFPSPPGSPRYTSANRAFAFLDGRLYATDGDAIVRIVESATSPTVFRASGMLYGVTAHRGELLALRERARRSERCRPRSAPRRPVVSLRGEMPRRTPTCPLELLRLRVERTGRLALRRRDVLPEYVSRLRSQ